MGNNFMVETVEEATTYYDTSECTAVPVEGGYMILEWTEYYRQIREEAESLYDRGWRASDSDCIESLIAEYCDDDNKITREWAGDIASALHDIEGYMWKYE